MPSAPSPPPLEVPPDAGPGGTRGWHDIVYRGLDVALGRTSPRARAWLSWRLDPAVYRLVGDILDTFVHPGDVVLDVGASWGLFTHRLARQVGRGGRVVAFEPNPRLQRSLRSMAPAGGNVVIRPVALSDASGRADLQAPTLTRSRLPGLRSRVVHPMASLAPPRNRTRASHEATSVNVARLDDVLAGVPEAEAGVTFVKCDVEGHELAMLRGAETTLERWRPPVLIEVEQRHQDSSADEVFAHLLERGYDGYVMRDGGLRPLADFDLWRDQVAFLRPNALFSAAPVGYLHNFLFVPAGTDVTALIAAPV